MSRPDVPGPRSPSTDSLSLAEERRELRGRLGRGIARGAGSAWPEGEFEELALAVFRYQVRANPVFGAFVANRGLDPSGIHDWRKIPPVPTRAFKELPLVCGSPEAVEAVFRTSGTTEGSGSRGEHRVRDLSLYRSSLLAGAAHYLRSAPAVPEPGGEASPLRVLALLPHPETRPDSSLVFMAGALMEAWDDGGGTFLAGPGWAPEGEAVATAIRRAAEDGTPVLLLGTAFAFVHWLDDTGRGAAPPLPRGSVVMETGGYKGRSREVPRAELYRALAGALGVPVDRIVNEYGMTELLSQFYEPVLRDGDPGPEARHHEGPPWVRSMVLNPEDLTPLPPGETGLLCHFDLANLDSVACVLTEDLGVTREGAPGFRLLGRSERAEPRGCSLVMEELLAGGGGGG